MSASELNNLKIHYFAPLGSNVAGRGEHIRYLLADAGIPASFVRYTAPDSWPTVKQQLIDEGFGSATLPFIQLTNGKKYGNVLPILRLLSSKLNAYAGRDRGESALVDSLADKAYDWGNKWIGATFGDDKAKEAYKLYTSKAYQTWDNVLKNSGTYLLGDEISYADFVLYHVIEDDRSTGTDIELKEYPHLSAFVEAVESRPNIQKYLATRN